MIVETAVCDACGAEVRDESLFCYNCGGSVNTKSDEPQPEVPELIRTESNDARRATELHSKDEGAFGRDGLVEQRPGSKPALRSAASLRKQRRASNRQPIEVTWERPAGPGIGFVITTVVLTMGALVLMLIALYLR
jgi:hypothetical protein